MLANYLLVGVPSLHLYPTRESHISDPAQTCVFLPNTAPGPGTNLGSSKEGTKTKTCIGRCPIDRAALLLAFVTANSTTPGQLRSLIPFSSGALQAERKTWNVMVTEVASNCHGN
jgi:hypothetical protein